MTKILSTRDGFGEGLVEAGLQNSEIVALSADVAESTRADGFKDKFPSRYFEVGVAEQNMVGMAVGLALSGKTAFAISYASFIPCRAYDQIRVSVAYNNANVKLVGSHAGLITGFDGASHQTLEDIAMMRALPNMTVVVPADATEAKQATLALSKHKGPAYLRLGRADAPKIDDNDSPFVIGKAKILRQGINATIVACGIMVNEALEAADELAEQSISAAVINCHTIKPLDSDTILRCVSKTKVVVTAEEAQISGGLGEAVASLVAENNPKPLKRIGVNNCFGQSGQPQELLEHYGLTRQHIVGMVVEMLKRC